MSQVTQYLYTITPVRANFIEEMTPEEATIMQTHFHYLQNLLQEGVLILAGPCLDSSFGIVILNAESEEAARQLMENDPAVANNVMTAELHPFRASLMQTSVIN